jgi:hypothetical protein
MVLTDGRHSLKASSVDREASRSKLEKRFGVRLAEHRASERERAALSPIALEIADDLKTLDRRGWLKADLARESERLEAARARLSEQRWARERAERAGAAFEKALEQSFREPAKARAAFEQRAREHGAARAAAEMRGNPEGFGELREAEQRRLLGLVRTVDRSHARDTARNAAELGRAAAVAVSEAPDAAGLMRAEQAVRLAERRVQEITDRLEQTRDNTRTRIRIGLAVRALTPHEVEDLHRAITAPHRQLTAELGRAAQKLAPAYVRELVHWARAPHLALPASATRAFRGLLSDRTMERGSE